MNYYELLNIERGADANIIKRAYFSMVKIHSPDKDPEGFKAIRLAYETLSNQKRRSEYDSYFVLSATIPLGGSAAGSGELQNKLLAAREMIRENKYKQAAEFLTDIIGTNIDSEKSAATMVSEFYTEAKRLLAETLLHMKKSGTAKKICEELLEKNPSDAETLLLRAKIAAIMGHTEKAGTYFNDAVNASPLNAKIWSAYLRYALAGYDYLVPGIFERAMEQDIDMFRDDYLFYLLGAYQTDLFSNKNSLKYYDKFAEFFLNDKNHGEEMYETLMTLIPHIFKRRENIPFLKKILPVLENSRHRKDDDEYDFKRMHTYFALDKLKSDKRIHEVFFDMTVFFVMEGTDKDELFGMEAYIVSHLSDLRPSIKVLKNEYPGFFKLNQAFYFDALNEKKEDRLIDKYAKKFKKIRPSLIADDFDDDFSEADESMPIVRSSAKIGRNEPCPCGSGKKHKKCCKQ